jgi:hypothetical protein
MNPNQQQLPITGHPVDINQVPILHRVSNPAFVYPSNVVPPQYNQQQLPPNHVMYSTAPPLYFVPGAMFTPPNLPPNFVSPYSPVMGVPPPIRTQERGCSKIV